MLEIFKINLVLLVIRKSRLPSAKFYSTTKNSKNKNLNRLLINMPRDTKHVQEAQKQRIKIKEKINKYVPGTVNLQVLGSGAPGSPASVYLFTDQQRYLFNCGEGTQRLAHEHKTKLARLEHIFLTRNCWGRTGGLPGLCLTVQDAGVPNLSLHGPPKLGEIFKAMKRFVILKDLKVDAPICNENNLYEDPVLTVHYVPISRKLNSTDTVSNINSETSNRSPPPLDDCTDYYAHETDGKLGTSSSNSSEYFDSNIAPSCETTVMSYICKLKPKPGQLNLEKCVEHGVPPGPLLGQLKNGFDITLPNGTVVKANDCKANDDPGPVFIVLDIPTADYLEEFEQKYSQYAEYIEGAEASNMNLVLHFTPQNIMNTEVYRKFIGKFPKHTTHLTINETNNFSGYIAAHRIQAQLNQLNQYVFPILKESPIEDYSQKYSKRLKLDENKNDEEMDEIVTENNRLTGATSMSCFHLRPNHGLDRSIEQKLAIDEYIQETVNIPNFPESLATLKSEINRLYTNGEDRASEYPKIIFLGTGSCIPNKTRNVSSILIHPNRESCVLLDCGEGTAGQIIRFYGLQEARNIFKKLDMIYISHLHADHHIGLIGLLQMRRSVIGDSATKLLLLAPKQISSWLYFYNRQIESISNDYELIGNASLLGEPLNTSTINRLGINKIETCLVKHCPHSFGVSLELNQRNDNKPIKIVYSGDTMPCADLVELGRNSTILIHEATMENDLAYEGSLKMHSTLNQAIEQGIKMNAKYVLLTHFSQRYAKLPRLDSDLDRNIGIAFDNMEVTVNDLEHLHILNSILKLMFSEHCEEMEQKALKRAYKKLRQQEQHLVENGPSVVAAELKT